jgi:FKBP12-rapamycin complex-associated protein
MICTGRDFKPSEELSVANQVNKLILKAVAAENLAQCFTGWCPFWVSIISHYIML